jgi:hypothetical protein
MAVVATPSPDAIAFDVAAVVLQRLGRRNDFALSRMGGVRAHLRTKIPDATLAKFMVSVCKI